MGCSACERRRKAALEKRRELVKNKIDRMTAECNAGNQAACLGLQNFLRNEQFRAENQFKPELHRRG